MATPENWRLDLIYDDVLVRSVIEYREAISVLEADPFSQETARQVDAMKQELATLEAELRRRGVDPVDPSRWSHHD